MNWEQITTELKKPLSPDAVKPPAPGKFGDYVEGKHVIDEANRIFGFNGWSYEVTRIQQVSEQTVMLKGKNGPYEQYRVGYLCTVRVCVDGVYREGAAAGSGQGKPEAMADHHESAIKEAETDALKRALRSFGNTFGLALYEKDRATREVGYAFDAKAEAEKLVARFKDTHTAAGIEKGEAAMSGLIGRICAEAPEIGNELMAFIARRKTELSHHAKPGIGDDETPYQGAAE